MKHRHLAILLSLVLTGAAASAQTTSGNNGTTSLPNAEHRDHDRDGGNRRIPDLTSDQKSQLKSIREEEKAQAQSIKNDSALTPEQKKQQLRALRQQTEQKVDGILTPKQQEALKERRHHRHHKYGWRGKRKGNTGTTPQ